MKNNYSPNNLSPLFYGFPLKVERLLCDALLKSLVTAATFEFPHPKPHLPGSQQLQWWLPVRSCGTLARWCQKLPPHNPCSGKGRQHARGAPAHRILPPKETASVYLKAGPALSPTTRFSIRSWFGTSENSLIWFELVQGPVYFGSKSKVNHASFLWRNNNKNR